MRIVVNDPNVVFWVQDRIKGCGSLPLESATLAFLTDAGRPVCAAVYEVYPDSRNVFLAFATDENFRRRWATRGIVGTVLGVPFRNWDARRISAVTAKRNKPSRTLLEKIGFKYEGTLREGWPGGGNAILYGLLRSEWERGKYFDGHGQGWEFDSPNRPPKPHNAAERTESYHPILAPGKPDLRVVG